MSWSSSGSVATYPTVRPAYNPTALSGSTIVLRADPNSGIVYVTGGFTTRSSPGTAPQLFTAALTGTFRPLTAVILNTGTSGNGGAMVTVTINADGTVTTQNILGPATYSLRSFYLTNVTPG